MAGAELGFIPVRVDVISTVAMSLQQYQRRRSNLQPYVDLASDLYQRYRRYSEDRSESRRRVPRRMPALTRVPRAVPTNIKQYTKRLLNRKIETKKRNIQINDITMKYVTWYYTDPLQFIAVGTGKNQRISDRISDVYLRYSVSYSHRASSTWEASWLRILIIATDKELAVDVATPAYSSTPGNGGSFDFLLSNDFHQSFGVADKNDYTIVYDRRIKSQKNLSFTDGSPVIHTIRKRLCKNATYHEDTTSGVQFQKGKNYYVLFGVSNPGSTVSDDAGQLQSSGYIYYKDG